MKTPLIAAVALLALGCQPSHEKQIKELQEAAWRARDSCNDAKFFAAYAPESAEMKRSSEKACKLADQMDRIVNDQITRQF